VPLETLEQWVAQVQKVSLETRVLKVTSVPLGTRVQSEILVLKEMWAPPVAQAQKVPLAVREQSETRDLKVR
jgi:hypothetical protein